MSCGCNSNGSSSGNRGSAFVRQMSRFIGETVTIFTTSGGVSGCGFTGVILSVNSCFVRLVTDFGTAPTNPLADNICGDMDYDSGRRGCGNYTRGNNNGPNRQVGSVVDIPVDRIVAFCHNAV